MKKLLPKALPAWILIVVIVSLLATQAAFFSIMSADRLESSQAVDLYRLNERALSLVKLLSATEKQDRKRIAASLANSTFAITVSQTAAVLNSTSSDEKLAELEDIMVARLAKFGITDAHIRLDPAKAKAGATDFGSTATSDTGEVEADLVALANDFQETNRYTVSLALKDSQWINFISPVTPSGPLLAPDSLPYYLGIALAVTALSIWSIRRLTAPYLLLERAVTRLGEDFRSAPLSESGSREYRSAARAVNAMQKRLLDYVEDREYLAAALAHDLRTPITRMRLRIELLRNSAVRDSLARDIANIERTVKSVIDFVKLKVVDEESERIDFWSMVYSVVDEYPDACIENDDNIPGRLLCRVQPTALRRCITNLMDNAVKYGKKAHIHVTHTQNHITLSIVDEGPGIPEDKIEAVFRPFKRMEDSRSRETGGSGLGLTIARALIVKMGGDIVLTNSQQGGLSATLSLPRITNLSRKALGTIAVGMRNEAASK